MGNQILLFYRLLDGPFTAPRSIVNFWHVNCKDNRVRVNTYYKRPPKRAPGDT